LNLQVLRRIAAASGGAPVDAARLDVLADTLAAAAPAAQLEVRRDLWHNAWSLLLIVGLLSGEWVLRRAWGLR
jgi:hypothetical protein